MKKIRKLIKSKEDFDKMMNILLERITDNIPISSNPSQIIKDIKMCDMCGNSFLGESFKVVDENFNLQRGLIQCGKCLVGE